MKVSIFLGAVALAIPSLAVAGDHPADGLVNFINSSSSNVDVSVDGAAVCSIAPGDRCSTVLSGDYSSGDHEVAGTANGRTWHDKIKVADCHANYLGTKTYTFRDDHVPFTCE